MKNVYVTLDEVQAKGIVLTHNNEWNLNKAKEVQTLIGQFWECEVMAELCNNDTEVYYFYCVLKNDVVQTCVNQISQGSKTWLHIYTNAIDTLKNIGRYELSEIRKKHDTLNKMSVPTTKKIAQHIEIVNNMYLEAKAINDKNGGEVQSFLTSIEGLPVKWWNDNTEGEIVQGGIVLKFTIKDGWVHKRIEVYYEVPSTVEAFKKLAENKYTPIKK